MQIEEIMLIKCYEMLAGNKIILGKKIRGEY